MKAMSPAQLVIPLDTHVIRVGRCLGLTRYASPGWRMARDITESLRRLDARDPVKYDYALCHLGMTGRCGFDEPRGDTECPLRGFCHPAGAALPRPRRTLNGRRTAGYWGCLPGEQALAVASFSPESIALVRRVGEGSSVES